MPRIRRPLSILLGILLLGAAGLAAATPGLVGDTRSSLAAGRAAALEAAAQDLAQCRQAHELQFEVKVCLDRRLTEAEVRLGEALWRARGRMIEAGASLGTADALRALEAAQAQVTAWRDAECEWHYQLLRAAGSDGPAAQALACRIGMTLERAAQMEAVVAAD